MEHKLGQTWSVPFPSKKCVDVVRSLYNRKLENVLFVQISWGEAPMGLLTPSQRYSVALFSGDGDC